MTRLFPILAGLNAVALVASFVLGTVSRLSDGVHHPLDPIYEYHFQVALITAFLTLLVHCMIFIYFLGTGRWVKEVALAYRLPDAPLPRETRELKRRAFPPALSAMLVVIGAAAAGAAAQVGQWPWTVHASLATLTLLVNGWAFVVEYRCLRRNVEILEGIYQEVDRVRAERGLPSNAEALQEQEPV